MTIVFQGSHHLNGENGVAGFFLELSFPVPGSGET